MLFSLLNGLLVIVWAVSPGYRIYCWLGKPKGGNSLIMWVLLGWIAQSLLTAIWSLVGPVHPPLMAGFWTGLVLLSGYTDRSHWQHFVSHQFQRIQYAG
ncbi:MAG: hypothetical protein AAFV07_18095, partial [Bacteroidota bacterium]